MALVRPRSHFLVPLIASLVTAFKRATFAPVTQTGFVRYEAPITADLVAIVADVLLANGALTIAAQPDVPRKLQVRITDANSSITAGTVTLVGVGPSGQAVTEVIALAGGTRTVTSTYAYAKLTSATVASLAGNASGDNIGIGPATALGLPLPTGAKDLSVYKATVANADEAVGTVDTTANTIVPTSAPNGTRVYSFWYTFKLHAGAADAIHLDQAEQTVTAAVATDLPTAITLAKDITLVGCKHCDDTLAHLAADTTNGYAGDTDALLANVAAIVDLTSAVTAANGFKASLNAHLTQSGVHNRNDAANAVSTVDATDLPSLITLLTALRSAVIAHLAAGPSAASWRATG